MGEEGEESPGDEEEEEEEELKEQEVQCFHLRWEEWAEKELGGIRADVVVGADIV